MVFFGWMDGASSARLSASFIIVVGGNPQDSQISPPVLCVKWRLVGDSEGVRHHGLARVPQMPLALAHQKTKTAVCFECAGYARARTAFALPTLRDLPVGCTSND